MNWLQYPIVLAVILSADFYAWNRDWDWLGFIGVICAAVWFIGGQTCSCKKDEKESA